ncbi:MAG TPA: prephenate dehydratase [Methanosarcinaceae archaeon]|nr:prephenate dehydratase [Methanosarcinaceae archaeon]
MKIGVLGPKGSYSEKAAKQWIMEQETKNIVSLEYYDDILDTISAIVDKTVDIGVVPIENSIEGSVGITLDMLLGNDLNIIGEIVVPIEHCLLSRGELPDIRVILSHPQALAQCRQFIRTHFKNAEIRTTGSTSYAAKLANEFKEMAAIASRESAQVYGLEILIPNIQDRKENHTRFIVTEAYDGVIADTRTKSPLPEDDFKTSIIVYLKKDRPGALYELIGEFAKRGINLIRIESRPSKRELGDYLFYIDFAGHIGDAIIKDALDNITLNVGMLKMLGSYPACNIEYKNSNDE